MWTAARVEAVRAALIAIGLAALARGPALAMTLTSGDLTDGAPMPAAHVYTRCGGGNVSPQLAWRGAPAATKSFVVTMIDFSVPPNDWSHWIVVDLPAGVASLARGAAPPAGAHGVTSDLGDAVYDGPCPPAGSGVHRYEITVWAMPLATTRVRAESAKALAQGLKATALDHATITVTAETP